MAINTIQGFNPSTTEPIDSRVTVANETARLAFATFNVYEGLVVYQEDTDELYVLNDAANPDQTSSWSTVGGGSGFPFTGSAEITGSLDLIGSVTITGSLDMSGSINLTGDRREINILGDDGQVALKLNDSSTGATDTGRVTWHVNGSEYGYITAIGTPGIDGLLIRGNTNRGITFQTNGTNTRMRIQEDGNVGIGTTDPQTPLHVNGHISSSRLYTSDDVHVGDDLFVEGHLIRLTGTGTNYIQTTSGDLKIQTALGDDVIIRPGGTDHFTFKDSGRLGIGTTSPGSPLTVAGRVDFQNDLRLRGTDSAANQGVTRFFVDSDNKLHIDTANDGSNEFIIDSSGKVGIGTSSTTSKLHLFSSTHSDFLDNGILLEVSSSDEGEPAIAFRNQSDMGSNYWIAGINNGGGNLDFAYGSAFTSANTKVRFASNGNVGIGTTNPSGTIHSYKATDNYVYIERGGGAALKLLASSNRAEFGTSNNHPFNITTNNQIGLTLDTSQNVGIGTTNPTEKLHVQDIGTSGVTGSMLFKNDNNDYTHLYVQSNGYGFRLSAHAGSKNGYIVGNGALNFASQKSSGGSTAWFGNGSLFKVMNPDDGYSTPFVLNHNNRVGIGTTSPTAKLHISGSGGGNDVLLVEPAGAPTISLKSNSTLTDYSGLHVGNKYLFLTKNSSAIFQQIQGGLRFANGFAAKSTITEDGYLGIGFNSPTGIDYPLDVKGDARISGSGIFTNGLTVTGSINHDGDLTVTGTVTAQEFHTEFVSASIVYESGSTKFGDTSDDVHSFTGSLHIQTSGSAGANRLKLTTAAGLDVASIYNGNSNTTPVGNLVLNYANTGAAILSGQSNGLSIRGGYTTNGTIRFNSYTTEIMRVNGTGLGIGITNPGSALDVNGTIRTTSTFQFYNTGGSVYAVGTYDASYYKFLTSGTERVRIDTAGNVGIGNSSPATKLDVSGSVRIKTENPILQLLDDNTTIRYAATQFATAGGNWFISSGDSNTGSGLANSDLWITRAAAGTDNRFRFYRDSYAFGVYSGSAAGVLLNADGNSYLNGGNVGIGTATPAEDLHVVDDVRIDHQLFVRSISSQYFSSSTNLSLIYGDAANFTVSSNATERMRIDSAGNVGIGTSSPSYGLEVSGSIGVKNDLYITHDNGSNPTDAGNLYFKEAGTTWGTDFYGFRVNQQGSSNYLNFQSANLTTVQDVLTLTRDTARVGIGTTSPSTRLEVSSSGANGIDISVDGSNSLLSGRLFFTNATSGQGVAMFNTSGDLSIRTGATPNSTSGTERLRLYDDGSILISGYGSGTNTGTPAYTLAVDSSGNIIEIDNSGVDLGSNTDVDTGTEVVDTFASGSGASAFTNYVVNDGTNYRAGQLMTVWNTAGSIEYTDVSTNSIGDTSEVFIFAAANGADIEIKATVPSDNWVVRVNSTLL